MATIDKPTGVVWPDGGKFAFSIFDDTDLATLDDSREIYSFLLDKGVGVTRAVWLFDSPNDQGITCDDPRYVDWLSQVREQGVEIAFHNAGHESSERERTIAALERFKEIFGDGPISYACHAECRENIYWGGARLTSPLNKTLYNILTGFRKNGYFQGHVEGSAWFWGDVCRDRIRYVRNFVFRAINTLAACPFMPYHDPARPFVNLWFAASDGGDAASFVKLIGEENQDFLEEQGGACIVYTHTGKGFCDGGRIHPEFVRLIERLSKKDGWFAPVSSVLDHLANTRGEHVISDSERSALERGWLLDRLLFSF